MYYSPNWFISSGPLHSSLVLVNFLKAKKAINPNTWTLLQSPCKIISWMDAFIKEPHVTWMKARHGDSLLG
jgi:hypothetical protein